ncbi:MAG: type IVB secretion system protein IcmD/DotP [Alphaproteobacteria bacterium]
MSITSKTAALAITVLALTTAPDLAHAEGLGGMAETLDSQLGSIAALISAVAFVLGLGLGASGLMKFRQHSDNPNAVPISQPIVRLVIAAMLVALPSVLGVGIGTFFGDDAGTVNLEDTIDVIDAQ